MPDHGGPVLTLPWKERTPCAFCNLLLSLGQLGRVDIAAAPPVAASAVGMQSQDLLHVALWRMPGMPRDPPPKASSAFPT